MHHGIRPDTIESFLRGLHYLFQREAASGLDATYHFTFTGEEPSKATVVIRNQQLEVGEGHCGRASLRVTVDSRIWLRFLARETNIVWALLRRKIRIARGSPKLLPVFGRCFPS